MTEELYDILTRPKRLREDIGVLDAKIDACLTGLLPGGIRYDLPKVQSSPREKFSEIMAKVDELINAREDKAEKLFNSVSEINTLANRLESNTERAVIIMHYIGDLSLYKIGNKLGYSKSGVHHIWQRGIDELEIFIKEVKEETKETAEV